MTASNDSPPAEPVAGSSSTARPLAGIRVVDLSRYLPGPLVSRLLADLGAAVIKVEEPRLGDPVRRAPPLVEGRSSLAALLLGGHRSVALDLKKEAARAVLDALLVDADVLVESYRPGTLQRFGLAPTELRRRHPRLVICSLTGYGQDGPLAGRAGHDLSYQAVAGSLAAGGGMPAVQVADIVGAWSAATAVTASLLRRERDGLGCWIDQALLDAGCHAALTSLAADAEAPRGVGVPRPLTGALPCYRLYRAADGGQVALALLERHFWHRFCAAVERPDLRGKAYSDDPAAAREIAALVASRPAAEWASLFAEHDLPGDVVLAPHEAAEHPQVKIRGMARRADDGLPRLGYPARIDGARPRAGERVAGLGADTREVLAEHGLEDELSRLRRWSVGIGRRPSFRRWAERAAGRVATRVLRRR